MDSNTRTVCDAKTRSPEFLLVLHHSDGKSKNLHRQVATRALSNSDAISFLAAVRGPSGRSGSARRLTCEPKIINRRHREPQLCDDLPETKNEQQRGERTDAE
jgi:hypothetical protein